MRLKQVYFLLKKMLDKKGFMWFNETMEGLHKIYSKITDEIVKKNLTFSLNYFYPVSEFTETGFLF